MSVLGFEVEWFDSVAGAAKKLYLKFFLENNTIEILEEKGAFLKRISYPTVRVQDLYVGSSISVFNRIIKIKSYANVATSRYMGSREVHFLSVVTANDANKLGRFFNLAKSYQLIVGKVRTTSSTVSLHGIEYGAGDMIVETVGVNGADIEGFSAAASALIDGITMALSVDKITELMGLYVPMTLPDDCTLCLIKPHILKEHLTGDVIAAIIEQGNYQYSQYVSDTLFTPILFSFCIFCFILPTHLPIALQFFTPILFFFCTFSHFSCPLPVPLPLQALLFMECTARILLHSLPKI